MSGVTPENWPKPEDCVDCGKSSTPKKQKFFPKVPTCPQKAATAEVPCKTNEGKFFDKLTRTFVVPAVFGTGDLFVCDPKLWSACQYIGICFTNKQSPTIAVFKIIDCVAGKLRVLNACIAGDAIIDNPQPGLELDSGSICYPVPPPWCSESFSAKLIQVLANKGCAGILACLENSDEICFTDVPVIDEEDGETHLFGGLLESMKSCLRKLNKIITGAAGKTLCMSEVPTTTDDPETIESISVPKNYAYFDHAGCLKRGSQVGVGRCQDGLDVASDSRKFDKLKVCKNGAEVLVPAVNEGETIVVRKDADNNPFWSVEQALTGFIFPAIRVFNRSGVLADGFSGPLSAMPPMPTVSGNAKVFGHFNITFSTTYNTVNQNGFVIVKINAQRVYYSEGKQFNILQMSNAVCALNGLTDTVLISSSWIPDGTAPVYDMNIDFIGYSVGKDNTP